MRGTFEDFESESEREEREAVQSGQFVQPDTFLTPDEIEDIEEFWSERARANEPFWK